MSITNGQQSWLPPAHLTNGNFAQNYGDRGRRSVRSHTPAVTEAANEADSAVMHPDGEFSTEEDAQSSLFRRLYEVSEARISALFDAGPNQNPHYSDDQDFQRIAQLAIEPSHDATTQESQPKKPARTFDEDNYDDDDEEEDEITAPESISKTKHTNPLLSPSKSGSSPVQSDISPIKPIEKSKESDSQPKTSEDARKQLEEAKKATEEAAKRSFHKVFYTLENDRVAMLEQQKLEETEKQIDAEMSHGGQANSSTGHNSTQHGSLSSANLGASSLTLKHLIARIDLQREKVKASDAELRHLMNEVRKNRSKWASEENVHQEELYEACEKVLSELKAMTEYSAPFLTRVNKREAPDYYNIITKPMDLGTMTKKLRGLQYKSKAEFVTDLDLIWSNCLKYNADISHPLRRNANAMRKEAEKLVPLIPDLVVRSRAEVEAEERRKQAGNEDVAGEESDDEPIMSSRGRKAPGKTGVKGRKSVPGRQEDTPGPDQKPTIQFNGLIGLTREGSETAMEGSQNGFATPPIGAPGSFTPSINGVPGAGSQADTMELDGPTMNGMSLGQALGAASEALYEDEEYKIWKQVTKKGRALVAKERNRLFKGDKLNIDEPALLRTRAGMKRWLRQQQQASDDSSGEARIEEGSLTEKPTSQSTETLAEGIENEEEHVLPDYYESLSAIPDIPRRLQWVEDSQGQVIDQSEEYLRIVPPGHFTAPKSQLTNKMHSNMRQMQETRKLCSKISIIKQMQLQTQMYNNQFQKYDPEPFTEVDIEPHVVTDDGAVMAPWVCRAALQRSVGMLCYHAGFEELQPSALDVLTDIAGDFFAKLARTFNVYQEAPKIPATGAAAEAGETWQTRFSSEEVVLHCLGESGLDIESLDNYARDEIDRLGNKLGSMHERMKSHLTDLLRPALTDAGPDGAGAFNDGSDQFVGGDFAEDLDEDFFGFKELGLDKELGLSSLTVPLHLLQSRMHSQFQAQNPSAIAAANVIFAALPPLEPVTKENIHSEIGLVKNFFLAKLHANGDDPLIEDEDLPMKQRFPKPRLPPTGKITSPRKRPLKELQNNAKKKKKLESGQPQDVGGAPAKGGISGSPEKNSSAAVAAKKLKLSLPNGGVGMDRADSSQGQTDKDDVSAVGMMSPESIER